MSNRSSSIAICCAADDNYAMPLAATARSVLDNLGEDTQLDLYVLDCGISPENQRRIRKSLDSPRTRTEFLRFNPEESLQRDALEMPEHLAHISNAAYARLFLTSVLPHDVEKILYLDCDMIARHNIEDLWNSPFEGKKLQAVQDGLVHTHNHIRAHFLSAFGPIDDLHAHLSGGYLNGPISREEIIARGYSPDSLYLNSGLLLIDTVAWRNDQIGMRAVKILQEQGDKVAYPDQDVINMLFADNWKPLDPQWNQQQNVFSVENELHMGEDYSLLPWDAETVQRVRRDPGIIHYTTIFKPWSSACTHPLKDLFFDSLDKTDWKGWRPTS